MDPIAVYIVFTGVVFAGLVFAYRLGRRDGRAEVQPAVNNFFHASDIDAADLARRIAAAQGRRA